MTICIATPTYYPITGGIPNYARYLAENLLTEGHKVILLTIDHSGDNSGDQVSPSDRLTTVLLKKSYHFQKNYYSQYFRPGGHAAHEWIAMGMAMKEWLIKNHREFRIDIIETSDYGGIGIFLVNDALPPLAVIGHSSITQLTRYNYTPNDDHTKVLKQLESLSYQYANGIIVHSPQNQEDLRSLTLKDVYFSRAPWIFPARIPGESGRPSDNNLIIGGLQLVKGAETMAAATKVLVRENPGWSATWIGADTFTAPGGKRVSDYLARRYKEIWQHNLHWIPGMDHQEILMAIEKAGTCIIPSRWETFNYFALEAAFLQKPLIMTRQTGSSYLFEEDHNVRIIPAEDSKTLAALLSDETMLAKWKTEINSSTRQRLMDYFSPVNIIEERLTIYNRIINQRKPVQSRVNDSLEFLKKYTGTGRKFYYSLRRKMKSVLKGR